MHWQWDGPSCPWSSCDARYVVRQAPRPRHRSGQYWCIDRGHYFPNCLTPSYPEDWVWLGRSRHGIHRLIYAHLAAFHLQTTSTRQQAAYSYKLQVTQSNRIRPLLPQHFSGFPWILHLLYFHRIVGYCNSARYGRRSTILHPYYYQCIEQFWTNPAKLHGW